MAQLTAFKLQGQTSGGTAITTVDISQQDDGTFIWTANAGVSPVIIEDPAALRLITKVLNLKTAAYP